MGFELRHIIVGGLTGIGLGALYFAALWWTVQRAVRRATRPHMLLALSSILRLAGALAAFYGLLWLAPVALLAGMLGFLVARQVWLRWRGGRGRLGRGRAERWRVASGG